MARVKRFYPRSFLRLILLGNLVVTLPLLVAIAYVSVNIETIASRSESAIRQATQAARLGNQLPEDFVHLDRVMRQYEALGDKTLLDDYAAIRRELQKHIDQYADIPLLSGIAAQVRTVGSTEAAAFLAFQNGQASSTDLRAAIDQQRLRLHQVLDSAGGVADAELENLRLQGETLRHRLLLAQILGVALALAFAAFGRRLLTRLLQRFERAVIALGQGKLAREIRLEGPQDMREVGRRLDWLRRRLLALEEERTLVLRHVSHELKTPLAALREGASLLTEGAAGPLTPGQEKIVAIMRNNSLRLQSLIDGLLKLQQAGYASDRLKPRSVRLDELAQQVLTTHQLAARNKRLRFSGSLAPLAVVGGREELTTIVDNLVSNAIKFSPSGGNICLSLTRDGDSAVLDVIDEGPGVPADDRQKIFEPFYRSAATKSVAGVGLGLAIAREFALAHRGSLELKDTPTGTHFRVALPLTGPMP